MASPDAAAWLLCPLGQRVEVFHDKRPRGTFAGTVIGYAFHEVTASSGEMHVSCVIRLDQPFDAPNGFYVNKLIVPHGGFRPAQGIKK